MKTAEKLQQNTNAMTVDSQDQINRGKKMAKAIITFKLMPESPEIDLEPIKAKALEIAKEAGAIGEMQSKIEPIAFGLKAVIVLAMYEVEGTEFDQIAEKMGKQEGVQSSEVAKMDLALG